MSKDNNYISKYEDTSKNNGIVLRQNTEANTEVEEGTSVSIVVNKISEEKTANLSINLKSLLKGDIYETESSQSSESDDKNTTNTTSTTENKKVKKVKVRVTINDKDLELDKKEYEATETIIKSFTGRNTVKIKVYIDGDWKNREESEFDLNKKTSINID